MKRLLWVAWILIIVTLLGHAFLAKPVRAYHWSTRPLAIIVILGLSPGVMVLGGWCAGAHKRWDVGIGAIVAAPLAGQWGICVWVAVWWGFAWVEGFAKAAVGWRMLLFLSMFYGLWAGAFIMGRRRRNRRRMAVESNAVAPSHVGTENVPEQRSGKCEPCEQ